MTMDLQEVWGGEDGSWIPLLVSFIPSVVEVITDILIWYLDPYVQPVAPSPVATQHFDLSTRT
jgi:hypothetical protein